jgi:hypothetical protein
MQSLAPRAGCARFIYTGKDERGEPLYAVPPEDFEQIRQGYGCAQCGELREYFFARCPVCNHARDLSHDFLPLPREWIPEIEEL